jgi:hypothetical protein
MPQTPLKCYLRSPPHMLSFLADFTQYPPADNCQSTYHNCHCLVYDQYHGSSIFVVAASFFSASSARFVASSTSRFSCLMYSIASSTVLAFELALCPPVPYILSSIAIAVSLFFHISVPAANLLGPAIFVGFRE